MNEADTVVQESISPQEDIRTWQNQLVRGVLRVLVFAGPLAVVAGSYYAYTTQAIWLIPFYLVAYGILLLITFWRRVPYALQAGILFALIYGLSILDFLQDGRGGSGRVFLVALPALAVLLFGWREGILALVLAILTTSAFGWAFSAGWLVIPVEREVHSADLYGWLSNTVVLVLVGSLLLVAPGYLAPRFAAALARSRKLTRDLEAERARLEKTVAERTVDLARRSTQLETAAQVAREATAIQDVGQLLDETVHLISDRFGFYHAGIFLLDEAEEYAVLRAASSVGGQRMLARSHRLRVGQEGIVGFVTGQGQPRIALDVGSDAVHFDNPDMPDTRSEMALPLRARGELIGALDVQSAEPEAFSQEDVAILQVLADQVAIAISNAQLFEQVQESLEAERRAYGEVSRQAWRELLRAQPELGFLSNRHDTLPSGDRLRPEMETALRTGQRTPNENRSAGLALPVKVRGQVIGVVGGRKPQDSGEWTAEEVALMEALTEQLSLALESARLYQDTQRRAERERLTGQVTTRMRETLDVETVIKTAVQEVRQALGLPEVVVRLVPQAATQAANGVDAERSEA